MHSSARHRNGIMIKDKICIEKFKTMNQLGRFTLRDEGKTIVIGKVVMIS